MSELKIEARHWALSLNFGGPLYDAVEDRRKC
jgi:hypothetical protein